MTVPARTNTTTAVEVVAKVISEEGGEPGSSLHSWRCEYPDRYGECSCVAETAEEIVKALRAAGLLADPTTRTEWGAVVCGEVCRHDTEQAARDCARTLGQGQIVRREVTAWTTVADTPAADDEGGQER